MLFMIATFMSENVSIVEEYRLIDTDKVDIIDIKACELKEKMNSREFLVENLWLEDGVIKCKESISNYPYSLYGSDFSLNRYNNSKLVVLFRNNEGRIICCDCYGCIYEVTESYLLEDTSIILCNAIRYGGRIKGLDCELKTENYNVRVNKDIIRYRNKCEVIGIIPMELVVIKDKVVVVPDEYTNKRNRILVPRFVDRISPNLFNHDNCIDEVIIKKGNIEIIPTLSFANCSELKRVELQEGIKRIDRQAFYSSNLGLGIDIPNTVEKIGIMAFAYSRLNRAVIPGSVKKISEKAFLSCKELKEIRIEDGVEFIGEYAFSECINLKSVIIPKSVRYIGKEAFRFCTELESIEIEADIEDINNIVFGCDKLRYIKIGNSINYYNVGGD